MRVPNRLIAVAALVVGPAAVVARGALLAVAGAAYASLVLLLARRLTAGGLGGADVKYALVLGAATGPMAVGGVLLGAAACAAVVLMVRRSGRLPFAPVLFAAGVAALVLELAGGLR
jgi:leader peptidase (prepilin peptidase)/N-methyltransferase